LCGSEYSNKITITVYPPLIPGSIDGAKTICYNQPGGTLGNVSAASGSNDQISYQWQKSENGTNWSNIQGETNLTYQCGALTVKTYFQRLAITTCKTLPSNVQIIDVKPNVHPGYIQGSQTICVGSAVNEVTSWATATGGDGSYSYQWQKSEDNVNWGAISGATNLDYQPGLLTVKTYFRRQATSCLNTVHTSTVTIAVDPYTNAGTLHESSAHFAPAAGQLSVSGMVGNVQRWQTRIPSVEGWTDIHTSVNPYGYVVSETTLYRVLVKSGICPTLPSDEITITIHPFPIINSSPNRIVFGSAMLDGGEGYSSYTWRNQNDQIVGTGRFLTTSIPDKYTVTVTKTGVAGSGRSQPFDLLTQMQGVNMNYIIVNSVTQPVTQESSIEALTIYQQSQDITYYDGLGRTLQTVSTQNSTGKKDMVLHSELDAIGREVKTYLPFVTSGNSGQYVPTPAIDAQSFYSPGQNNVAGDNSPYAVKIYEPSPLNRIIKQGGPGEPWQPDPDPLVMNDKSLKKVYRLNVQDEVARFRYDATTGALTISAVQEERYYTANQLFVNVTYDEHTNEVMESVDKEGRTICKKVQYDTVGGIKKYAATYYVYDNYGNLVFVLPPEAVISLIGE
jgi:hypothetical protein